MLDPGRLTRTLFLIKFYTAKKCDPKASGSGFFIPEEEGVPGNSLAAALSKTCGSIGIEISIFTGTPQCLVLLRL